MNTMRILAASVIAVCVTASGASGASKHEAPWVYLHIDSEKDAGWKAKVEGFLNRERPQLINIRGALSYGKDFHIWVRKDGDGPSVVLQCVDHTGEWGPEIQDQIEKGEVAIIGFNASNPPCLWEVLKR